MAFGLPPPLAVGLMLLAASAGGTTAHLFSHRFRGDVALNITGTAVNSLIAVVLVPVVIGMDVRQRATAFADRMDTPVRIASAVVLALVIVGTIVGVRENIAGYIRDVGLPALQFCLAGLTVGFVVPRLLGLVRRQAIASAFEIDVHNGTLAIAIAISVPGQRRARRPGRRPQRDHVPGRRAVRLGDQPVVGAQRGRGDDRPLIRRRGVVRPADRSGRPPTRRAGGGR